MRELPTGMLPPQERERELSRRRLLRPHWIAAACALFGLALTARSAWSAQVEVTVPGVRIAAVEQPRSAQIQVPGAKITVTPGEAPAPVGDTLDLAGKWKFKGDWVESGLSEGWQKPEYDDAAWKELDVPGSWEEQGINTANPRWPPGKPEDGYNGYAWYRKHFTVPADWAGAATVIEFGAIDDYDWIYLNGQMVGSTTTGEPWEESREYSIPAGILKPGADNVIAVRVWDKSGSGGITEGPVLLRKEGAEPAAAPAHYAREMEDVVRVGGNVSIASDEKVNGDVVAIGGQADISGYVTGSVIAVGGNVYARSGSHIEGDAVTVGGRVEKADDAIIGGQQVTAGPVFGWKPGWHGRLWGRGRYGFFGGLLIWAFITLLAILLFRTRLEVMADALPLHPGRAAAYGLAGIALTPAALAAALVAQVFVIVVLAITIVGILAIPAVAVAMAAMVLAPGAVLLVGMAGVFLSLGRAATGQLGRPQMHPIWAAFVGVLLIAIAGLIPYIGPLVWITVIIFGFGVALMTGIGSSERYSYRNMRLRRRAEREENESAPSPAPPSKQPSSALTPPGQVAAPEQSAAGPAAEPPPADGAASQGPPPSDQR
ncbi:MAG: sugar-binding domain-containing protein [Armatimonadota bacterium]